MDRQERPTARSTDRTDDRPDDRPAQLHVPLRPVQSETAAQALGLPDTFPATLLRAALNAAGIDSLAEVADTELVERVLDTWQGRALLYGMEAVAGTPEPQTITAEAEAAAYGDRQDDYGHPRQNLTRTAVLWTGLLQHKLAEGEHITPEDVARLHIAGKLSRDVNAPTRDNRVDIAGYALTLDRLETGR